MTKPEEIQKELDKKLTEFRQQPNPHKLPKWFYADFAKIIMVLSPAQVPYRGIMLKNILQKIEAKNPESLTIFEVTWMGQVWLNMPPCNVDSDIYKYLIKRLIMEDIYGQLEEAEQTKQQSLHREYEVRKDQARSRIVKF